jgi:hypothetical protein
MIQHVDYGKPRRALLEVIDLLAEYGRAVRNQKADSTSGKVHESAAEATSPEGKSGVLP